MRIVVAGGTGVVGAHVVAEAERRGHEAVALSRRNGQDVVTGAGLAAALAGADAVVDVTSVETLKAAEAVAFFEAASRTLLAAERDAGVAHHVALSIVGIDRVPEGYYAGKLAQEQVVAAHDGGWSILRATQFHEFAGQVLGRVPRLPVALVPAAAVRTVAARDVAAALLDIVESGPSGRVADLTGPEDAELPDLARRLLRHEGVGTPVVGLRLPGSYWRGLRSGALRGAADARRGAITFDEWLASPDRVRP